MYRQTVGNDGRSPTKMLKLCHTTTKLFGPIRRLNLLNVSLVTRTCNVWHKELSRHFVGHRTSFHVLWIRLLTLRWVYYNNHSFRHVGNLFNKVTPCVQRHVCPSIRKSFHWWMYNEYLWEVRRNVHLRTHRRLGMIFDTPTKVGKHVTSNTVYAMCPAKHKQFSLLIGPNTCCVFRS